MERNHFWNMYHLYFNHLCFYEWILFYFCFMNDITYFTLCRFSCLKILRSCGNFSWHLLFFLWLHCCLTASFHIQTNFIIMVRFKWLLSTLTAQKLYRDANDGPRPYSCVKIFYLWNSNEKNKSEFRTQKWNVLAKYD